MSQDPARPLRMFCRCCHHVSWHPIRAVLRSHTCCGRDLLIAGAAKLDRHGLRMGGMVDPVAEYLNQQAAVAPSRRPQRAALAPRPPVVAAS